MILPKPSVAQGMAALMALLGLFTLGHLAWTFLPRPQEPWLGTAPCEAPVEVHEAGYDRLGCATEPNLVACGAQSLDRIVWRDGGCTRTAGGLRAAWRRITAQKMDLNQASAADLALGPDLGPQLAERVVQERQAHGLFASMDDLRRVPGLGPVRIQRLRTWLMVVP